MLSVVICGIGARTIVLRSIGIIGTRAMWLLTVCIIAVVAVALFLKELFMLIARFIIVPVVALWSFVLKA